MYINIYSNRIFSIFSRNSIKNFKNISWIYEKTFNKDRKLYESYNFNYEIILFSKCI